MTGLPWVRLDGSFPTHDKILALLERRNGARAGFVYVCSLAYSGANGTDGVIPFNALTYIHGQKSDAAALVEVALWKPDPAGWVIPNWAARQQTVQSSRLYVAGQRRASAKGNCVRWHGADCGCWARTPPDAA